MVRRVAFHIHFVPAKVCCFVTGFISLTRESLCLSVCLCGYENWGEFISLFLCSIIYIWISWGSRGKEMKWIRRATENDDALWYIPSAFEIIATHTHSQFIHHPNLKRWLVSILHLKSQCWRRILCVSFNNNDAANPSMSNEGNKHFFIKQRLKSIDRCNLIKLLRIVHSSCYCLVLFALRSTMTMMMMVIKRRGRATFGWSQQCIDIVCASNFRSFLVHHWSIDQFRSMGRIRSSFS